MKKTYQNASLIMLLFALILLGACKKNKVEQPANDSFLPMQIGNLWYLNGENYTEIKDTVRINNKLFYKFFSLIGGDAFSVSYLRIDEQNRWLRAIPHLL